MFEHRNEPIATRWRFVLRIFYSFLMTLGVIALSLGLGTWGYHYYGGLGWIDAQLNAAMILTGMGPVNPMQTPGAKLFATFYCLFSGIIFLTLMAILLTPLYHRLMHKFHLDRDAGADAD